MHAGSVHSCWGGEKCYLMHVCVGQVIKNSESDCIL